MSLRRVLLGALSSVTWPAVVVCIPAGITFFSTRVLAESAPYNIEPCDASAFMACADAEPLAFCSSTECIGARCACVQGRQCLGASSPAQACRVVDTCESQGPQIAACKGIPVGASCTQQGAGAGKGSCKLDRCLVPGDAGFVGTPEVLCYGNELPSAPSAPDAATIPPAPSTTDAPRAALDDAGGCTASSGTAQGAALVLGLPLAMGLLLARRRRR